MKYSIFYSWANAINISDHQRIYFRLTGPLCSVTTMRRKFQPQLFHLHVKGSANEEVRDQEHFEPIPFSDALSVYSYRANQRSH